MNITIYHNPACGTSRNTLEMIRKAGIEPTIIEYLKTPPTRDELVALIEAMPISARELLRKKGTPYHDLGLDNPDLTDDQLIDAMMEHPILINRPIVISDQEVNLCRPSEKVMALLPTDIGSFTKEDGEVVTSDKDQAG
nr:arsenate reductase (glutaredoxin) [uncultured Cohaesibacter sp.]